MNEFSQELRSQMSAPLSKVKVTEVVEDPNPPRLLYQPDHPDANPQGYVAYPNVNTMEEMVNMITASRTYEANVTAISVSRNMMNKALDIGRR
jgi:flagellar basal-body rod protein FlgC